MIRAVLIDLSGTLHIENQAIRGSVEALKKWVLDTISIGNVQRTETSPNNISLEKVTGQEQIKGSLTYCHRQRLSQKNVQVRFVTNTTKESKRILYDRLMNLGFELNKDDIFSSLGAARSLILERKLKPMLMLSPEALEDFEGLACSSNESPNAVIIGLCPTEFHYERLNEAFRYLQAGAKLIAIHAGKYYARGDGLALGPGCFVKGLEYSAQCTAEIVGKPNKLFFKTALGHIPPEEAVMIGDDVTDDIQGAMSAGLQGYLVQTGKYKPGDEKKIIPPPTAVFSSFVEAVENILTKCE